MAEVWFYHLEHTALEAALPGLLEKCVEKGWHVYVHGADEDMLSSLDRHLWAYRPDSFLPHGLEGAEHATRQPVLLGTSGQKANAPQAYVSVGMADLPALDGIERSMIIFEGHDQDHLTWARARWKDLKTQGHSLSYWQQNEGGRWEKKQ